MKTKRQIAVFLAVVLMLANSGLTLFAHTCLRSQHTSIQFTQNDECCTGEEEAHGCCDKKVPASSFAERHDNCCSVSLIHIEPNAKQLLPLQFTFVTVLAVIHSSPAFAVYQPNIFDGEFGYKHSPPLPTTILQQICLLRI